MSKQMLCSFFPTHCSHIFEPYLPNTFALLFPEDVAEACPEQVLELHAGKFTWNIWSTTSEMEPIRIRRPWLAVFAVLGMLIGFVGGARIYDVWQKRQTNQYHHDNAPASMLRESPFYWTVAFVSFGFMNLSGFLLHCCVESTTISAVERPLPWIGDAYSTGVFGAALWAASMMESVPVVQIMQKWDTRHLILYSWLVGNVVGLLAIACFLLWGYHPESTVIPGTFPLELWYALPSTLFASSGLSLLLIRQQFSATLLVTFVLSYGIFVVSLLDPIVCRQFGNRFWDLLTTPTLFFGATDIVFVGLWAWLEQRHNSFNGKLADELEKLKSS